MTVSKGINRKSGSGYHSYPQRKRGRFRKGGRKMALNQERKLAEIEMVKKSQIKDYLFASANVVHPRVDDDKSVVLSVLILLTN